MSLNKLVKLAGVNTLVSSLPLTDEQFDVIAAMQQKYELQILNWGVDSFNASSEQTFDAIVEVLNEILEGGESGQSH